MARIMAAGNLRSDYEAAVRAIRDMADAMRQEGQRAEAIARAAHAERRRLAAFFKEKTPEPTRQQLYRRTLAIYGDRLGPSIEMLRAGGKTWEDIIESATRPGSVVFDNGQLVPQNKNMR